MGTAGIDMRDRAAALGSVYGEIQVWSVDLQNKTVTVTNSNSRRIVGKRQSPFDVEPSAEEIAAAIRKGGEDVRLKWYGESKVQVLIGKLLVPDSAVKQRLAGRRTRLRAAIRERLIPFGWREVLALGGGAMGGT